MIIKYKEPWCLNPDIISYGMNSGSILDFGNSNEFSFYIRFNLIGGKQDEISNIVWKGNDELGIQIIADQIAFTFRIEDNQDNKEIGVIKFFTPIDSKTNFEILINAKDDNNHIIVNNNISHSFGGHLIFLKTSTYNFGGGHRDNIEYDLDGLVIAKKMYSLEEIHNIETQNDIDINVLGCYNFNKKTEQKVWDKSKHFNLLNRFYL